MGYTLQIITIHGVLKMKSILKRLFNVITALAMLWLTYVFFGLTYELLVGHDGLPNVTVTTRDYLIRGFLVLLIVSITNYIFFGKLSLWHKNDKP